MVPPNLVHLIDNYDQVLAPQVLGQHRVLFGLTLGGEPVFKLPIPGADNQAGHVGLRGSLDHVNDVLLVPGAVYQYELLAACVEHCLPHFLGLPLPFLLLVQIHDVGQVPVLPGLGLGLQLVFLNLLLPNAPSQVENLAADGGFAAINVAYENNVHRVLAHVEQVLVLLQVNDLLLLQLPDFPVDVGQLNFRDLGHEDLVKLEGVELLLAGGVVELLEKVGRVGFLGLQHIFVIDDVVQYNAVKEEGGEVHGDFVQLDLLLLILVEVHDVHDLLFLLVEEKLEQEPILGNELVDGVVQLGGSLVDFLLLVLVQLNPALFFLSFFELQ